MPSSQTPVIRVHGSITDGCLAKVYSLTHDYNLTCSDYVVLYMYTVDRPEALACVYVTRVPSPTVFVTFNQPVKVHM